MPDDLAANKDVFDRFVTFPRVIRFLIAFLVFYIGVRFSGNYLHLCTAGFRSIEIAAVIGSSFLPFFLILLIPKYRISLPISFLIILTLRLLERPYLDWVHGH